MKRGRGCTHWGQGSLAVYGANLNNAGNVAGKTGRYKRGRAGRQKSTAIKPAAATLHADTWQGASAAGKTVGKWCLDTKEKQGGDR